MVANQNLAPANAIGGADDAFHLHLFNDPGGAIVADLQVTLDEAGGCLAFARDESQRFVIKGVTISTAATG